MYNKQQNRCTLAELAHTFVCACLTFISDIRQSTDRTPLSIPLECSFFKFCPKRVKFLFVKP